MVKLISKRTERLVEGIGTKGPFLTRKRLKRREKRFIRGKIRTAEKRFKKAPAGRAFKVLRAAFNTPGVFRRFGQIEERGEKPFIDRPTTLTKRRFRSFILFIPPGIPVKFKAARKN